MISTTPIAPLLATAWILIAAPARADVIRETSGKVIEGVTVVEETLAQVLYKKGSAEHHIASDKVLKVEYEKYPRLVGEAEALANEDDLLGALDQLDLYVDGQIQKPSERKKWAPAYAAWRALELRTEIADLQGLIRAADRLIKGFPNSRYLPAAYLAKAQGQFQEGKAPAAQRTLTELESLIAAKGLPDRWRLECELAKIETDVSTAGSTKRERLLDIEGEAGEYPTVMSRLRVVEGETYLQEAEKSVADPAAAQQLRDQAREVFQAIIDEFKADDETLAAAYTGIGDCLYYSGVAKQDPGMYAEAVMSYLRVVTLYEGQSRFVPRAYYGAMRCFDLLEDKRRQYDMKRKLKLLYPRSRWAAEADKH